MSTSQKVFHSPPAESVTRLKAEKLGRHYHKIPQQIVESAQKYPRLIPDYFLRNYRVDLELKELDVDADCGRTADTVYRCEHGKVGFSIARPLLAEALEFYYGGSGLNKGEPPPVSASEERLRKRLGKDIIDVFARAALSGGSFGELTEQTNDYEDVVWEYVARFHYISRATGAEATIAVHLDTGLVDELIRRLTRRPGPCPSSTAKHNLEHLPVRLECVLADWMMPLAQVLSLEPDDVLVVRPLERYEIRIGQQECFKGMICENEGALYLTSLEPVESV